MGTPEAGKLFLESLTGSGLEDLDLDNAPVFDTVALNTIRDIKATDGRVTCVIPVEPRVQNRYGTLHGGCIGALHLALMDGMPFQRRCLQELSGSDLSQI